MPILLANLVSLGRVALTYQPNIEQILVLLPPSVEMLQGSALANRDTKQAYKGLYLSFNLNVNLPPPCTTGYLPPNRLAHPAKWTTPTGRTANCTAAFRRTRCSTCAARATCRA